MVGGSYDRRAGGERPRLTLRQRLSIKHFQMIWEAVLERLGRGLRQGKKKRKRRQKLNAMRQAQKEIGPELKNLESSVTTKSGNLDIRAIGCCFPRNCGCLVEHIQRSRLTVTDSAAPPVYSNDQIINDIVPPLQLATIPPRAH